MSGLSNPARPFQLNGQRMLHGVRYADHRAFLEMFGEYLQANR
jgi:hypothetical protein